MNDGSTDDTVEAAQAWADSDSRIRIYHRENGGISAARNTALEHASGQFIAILDSDDLWQPAFLDAQLAIFAARPDVDIVTGNGWFLGGRLHGRSVRPSPDVRPQPTLQTILADEMAIFIMSVFRRRVYETIGGFDATLRSNEDYDYWLRAGVAGFTFWRNDTPLGHYRRRDDSVSALEVRMIDGICGSMGTRPLLLDRPAGWRSWNGSGRSSVSCWPPGAIRMSTGEQEAAADHPKRLYASGGGAVVGVDSFMARRLRGCCLARIRFAAPIRGRRDPSPCRWSRAADQPRSAPATIMWWGGWAGGGRSHRGQNPDEPRRYSGRCSSGCWRTGGCSSSSPAPNVPISRRRSKHWTSANGSSAAKRRGGAGSIST